MTDKQIKFAHEYLVDLNATQAAIRAGYSVNTAAEQGYQLLNNEEVSAHICELRAKQQERTDISADRVLKEVARLAFSDIRNYYDDNGFLKLPKDLTDDAAAALSGIDIDELYGFVPGSDGKEKIGESKKIKLHSKTDGLEKLMKHLGLYGKDNQQKAPVINISNLSDEELKIFIALSNKAIATGA